MKFKVTGRTLAGFLLFLLIGLCNSSNGLAIVTPNSKPGASPVPPARFQALNAQLQLHSQIYPGRIIVEFNETAGETLRSKVGKDLKIDNALTSIDSIDKLNMKYHVGISPLYKSLYSKMLAYGKTASQISDDVNAQYPVRASRASPNAVVPHLEHWFVLQAPSGTDVGRMLYEYQNDPNVKLVELDKKISIAAFPKSLPANRYVNPSGDGVTWSTGAWGQSYPDMWGLKKIQANQAWPMSQGKGIIVAVIDTGVDYTHPNLAGNVLINQGNETNHGYNFVNNTNDPMDDMGHGTHVAGTIAAIANSGQGVVGVAPQAMILPVKFLNSTGQGFTSDADQAIEYAADNGAEVINNSWGPSDDPGTAAAIEYAYAKGCVLVFAAGNDDVNAITEAPGNTSEIITVAASDENDNKCFFSNFGPDIDVSAPGGGTLAEWQEKEGTPGTPGYNILSLLSSHYNTAVLGPSGQAGSIVGTSYLTLAGTSMATPHVAGLAALILSKNPQFSALGVKDIIDYYADPVGTVGTLGFDPDYGYGRINALNAVQANAVPVFSGLDPLANHNTLDKWGDVVGTVKIFGQAYGPEFKSYTIDYSKIGSTTWTIIKQSATSSTEGELATFDTTKINNGEYDLRLSVQTKSGKIFRNILPLDVDRPVAAFVVQWSKEFPGYPGNDIYFADMNNDGNKEIVLGNGDISDLSGNLVSTPQISGQLEVESVAVGDLNGDGNKELVLSSINVTNDNNGIIAVDKNGAVLQGWPFELNTGYFNFDGVSLANLNGQPGKEIIFASRLGVCSADCNTQVNVLKPDGTALANWPKALPGATMDEDPAIADLDSMGLEDIIAPLYSAKQVAAWKYDGTSLAGFPVSTGTGAGIPYMSPVVADLDNDGLYETIATTDLSSVTNGSGIFVWDNKGNLRPGFPKSFSSNEYTRTNPAVGDLNNDGNKEIVVVNSSSGTGLNPEYGYAVVHAYKKGGAELPGFPINLTFRSSLENVMDPVIADIKGDGKQEIIVPVSGGLIYAFNGNGSMVSGWPSYKVGNLSLSSGPVVLSKGKNGKLLMALMQNLAPGQTNVELLKSTFQAGPISWGAHQHDSQHTGWAVPLPLAPTGLTAAPVNGQVAVSWSKSKMAESYTVQKSSVKGGPYTLLKSGIPFTSYLDATAQAGTINFYVVSATNTSGDSAKSAEVEITLSPPAPTALAAKPGTNKVVLSWKASTGAASYDVKRSAISAGTYSVIGSTASGTTYTDTTAKKGITYYYVVSAVNTAGQGPNSAQATATPA